MKLRELIIILLSALIFTLLSNNSYAEKFNINNPSELPKVPQYVYDIAEQNFEDYAIWTKVSNHGKEITFYVGKFDVENISTEEYTSSSDMIPQIRVSLIKELINIEYEDHDTSNELYISNFSHNKNSNFSILYNGQAYNRYDVFDIDRSWSRLDFVTFDIYHEGKLIRSADQLIFNEFEVIQTQESINVDYNFVNYDSMQIEVYEYDFKNMVWNEETKEVFDIPIGDNVFEYKQGIGNKFSRDKYYGFEIKAYKNDELTYSSETVLSYGVGSKYQVLPKDTSQYLYPVSSPRNLQLGKVDIEDKDYYGLTWDTTGELFNVEVQIKKSGEDFTHASLLKNGEDTYICSYSDKIESFRIRKIDKDNEERFSDWVVIDKDSSVVYHGNDYYMENGFYPNGDALIYSEDKIMELKPKLPENYNPLDYIKYILETISWFITYILYKIRNFIAQVGNVPNILQEVIPFLPWEVTTMLSAGVTVSVLLRIFGKK